ncbi:MotE family protein [Pseudooctadecabacter jejudonensis]|uniref:MgtE intracellular N domain protein n=1 Tax=Pseudooctadecabacter jejudonensis TaxID=1391910 RepID=A0A1Y5S4M3_9RHOB|nr:hypothetical protein [Pseudooctadecabacter jejudonensis]SLN32082.1 hypothetical protein PSJ8397_01497 [Pseudooctadecabacter jejudonensis]
MIAGRKQKHVLMVVAALLLASGIVRVSIGMGPALAIAETSAEEIIEPAEDDISLDPLIAALREREQMLDQREAVLADRLRALDAANEEIDRRLGELEAAEESLLAAVALSETANDSDITRLTAVYETMKSADAASLFEQMAPEFASGFLVRMQPEAAAAIMAGLDPQTAYSISVIIAGRNANAPTQ